MIKRGRYNTLNTDTENFNQSIKTFVPSPSDADYKKGYITRYFVQRTNDIDSFIFEISNSSISRLKENKLFTIVNIDWRITGDVEEVKKSNSASLRVGSKTLQRLHLYLPNLLQFHKK